MNMSRYALLMPFALVSPVWGMTFPAIRVGVNDLPPALFSGSRFIVAGVIMAMMLAHPGE